MGWGGGGGVVLGDEVHYISKYLKNIVFQLFKGLIYLKHFYYFL